MTDDELRYDVSYAESERPARTKFERWLKDGKLHRIDGPAEITTDDLTGAAIQESWEQEGQRHREGGPAHTDFGVVSGVITKAWWRHGKLHREDGPAVTQHLVTGELIHESWHIDGQFVRSVLGTAKNPNPPRMGI